MAAPSKNIAHSILRLVTFDILLYDVWGAGTCMWGARTKMWGAQTEMWGAQTWGARTLGRSNRNSLEHNGLADLIKLVVEENKVQFYAYNCFSFYGRFKL